VKRFPVVGLVVIITDVSSKGLPSGICNSVLDACPALGWGKLVSECIWGDWFPDKGGVDDE
jgi:hypothetical protein